MSTLVKENRGNAAQGQVVQAAKLGGSTIQQAFTGTSAQTAALGASTSLVALHPTEDCWVAMGDNPTANDDGTASMFLAADQTHYMGVVAGQKLAVVSGGTNGNLYVYECP